MTDVWVVQCGCGDYYCDAEHIVGIYSDEQRARTIVSQLEEMPLGGLAEPNYTRHSIDSDPDLTKMPAT
jgi:hypothetical protein